MEPRIEPPSPGRPEEFGPFMEHLDGIFDFEGARGGMARNYRHIYRPELMHNNILIRRGGRIVSSVGVFPMLLKTGFGGPPPRAPRSASHSRVRYGAIGGVATASSMRGRGLMKRLMGKATERMEREGMPISILWGDRRRYNHFGYESCGRAWGLRLEERSLADHPAGPIRPVRVESEANWIDRMALIHGRRELSVKRTGPARRGVYLRGRRQIWIVPARDPRRFAYAILGESKHRSGCTLIEELGGNAESLVGLLKGLFGKLGLHELYYEAPFRPGPEERLLQRLAKDVSLVKVGEIRINSLLGTVEGFLRQMDYKRRLSGNARKGAITLRIKGTDDAVALKLGGGSLAATRARARGAVALDRCAMARLLFGFVPPSSNPEFGRELRCLDPILPLDLFVPKLDYV